MQLCVQHSRHRCLPPKPPPSPSAPRPEFGAAWPAVSAASLHGRTLRLRHLEPEEPVLPPAPLRPPILSTTARPAFSALVVTSSRVSQPPAAVSQPPPGLRINIFAAFEQQLLLPAFEFKLKTPRQAASGSRGSQNQAAGFIPATSPITFSTKSSTSNVPVFGRAVVAKTTPNNFGVVGVAAGAGVFLVFGRLPPILSVTVPVMLQKNLLLRVSDNCWFLAATTNASFCEGGNIIGASTPPPPPPPRPFEYDQNSHLPPPPPPPRPAVYEPEPEPEFATITPCYSRKELEYSAPPPPPLSPAPAPPPVETVALSVQEPELELEPEPDHQPVQHVYGGQGLVVVVLYKYELMKTAK
ncbi:hypothetical protein JOM56_007956 [Amanita muscaria]